LQELSTPRTATELPAHLRQQQIQLQRQQWQRQLLEQQKPEKDVPAAVETQQDQVVAEKVQKKSKLNTVFKLNQIPSF
jgi:hypothetical protein